MSMNDAPIDFRRLKELRNKHGISQTALAEAGGIYIFGRT